MPHVFTVDAKKWEEAQQRAREFWESEEGQKLKQNIRACAASFDELIKTGKTTVKIVTNKEDEIKNEKQN